ncbi:hypothetical protein EsH8_II_001142 [Colletotrichum jinshuiense]
MGIVEHSARSILQLTTLIDVAPYTAMWMMAGIPVLAFFVMFDLVIHNPHQSQISTNLALLDVAIVHYKRMDQLSNGALPGSMIAEFAHIARAYVNEVTGRSPASITAQASSATSQIMNSQPQWSLPQENEYAILSNAMNTPLQNTNLALEAEYMDIEGIPLASNQLTGTNVMNLFGVWLPDFDQMFHPGLMGQPDIIQPISQEHLDLGLSQPSDNTP